MVSEARFVGLDAGNGRIEASVRPTGEVLRTDACDDGMTRIAESITRLQPQLVVMQANGSLELPLAGILVTFKLPVALVQPRNVREFARAIGRLSRVEQHQSGLLAQFAEFVHPEVTLLPDEQIEELKQLRQRRTELLEMINLEKSRIGATLAVLDRDIQSHIQFLERGISALDAQFSRRVRISRIWH